MVFAMVVMVIVIVVVMVIVVLLKRDEKVSALVKRCFGDSVALGSLVVSTVERADDGQVIVIMIGR